MKNYKKMNYRFTGDTIKKIGRSTDQLKVGDQLIINGDKHVRGTFRTTEGESITLVNGVVCKIKNRRGLVISAYGKDRAFLNIILQDSTGEELEFPEVELYDYPAPGNRIVINGKRKETGKRLMPDGTLITFKEGVITRIQKEDVLKSLREDLESITAYYKRVEQDRKTVVKRLI